MAEGLGPLTWRDPHLSFCVVSCVSRAPRKTARWTRRVHSQTECSQYFTTSKYCVNAVCCPSTVPLSTLPGFSYVTEDPVLVRYHHFCFAGGSPLKCPFFSLRFFNLRTPLIFPDTFLFLIPPHILYFIWTAPFPSVSLPKHRAHSFSVVAESILPPISLPIETVQA